MIAVALMTAFLGIAGQQTANAASHACSVKPTSGGGKFSGSCVLNKNNVKVAGTIWGGTKYGSTLYVHYTYVKRPGWTASQKVIAAGKRKVYTFAPKKFCVTNSKRACVGNKILRAQIRICSPKATAKPARCSKWFEIKR
jgi:hypothetical protein